MVEADGETRTPDPFITSRSPAGQLPRLRLVQRRSLEVTRVRTAEFGTKFGTKSVAAATQTPGLLNRRHIGEDIPQPRPQRNPISRGRNWVGLVALQGAAGFRTPCTKRLIPPARPTKHRGDATSRVKLGAPLVTLGDINLGLEHSATIGAVTFVGKLRPLRFLTVSREQVGYRASPSRGRIARLLPEAFAGGWRKAALLSVIDSRTAALFSGPESRALGRRLMRPSTRHPAPACCRSRSSHRC
jgi:hypothetical protein